MMGVVGVPTEREIDDGGQARRERLRQGRIRRLVTDLTGSGFLSCKYWIVGG